MKNIVLDALKHRRSIRKYSSEQITDEELIAVLEAGTYAPTGHNKQDLWIVAVQKKDIMEKLIRMNATIMGTDTNPYYDAPTIVLVFGSPLDENPNTIKNGSLILGNMMNAAYAIGLGSCWINRETEMFSTAEGKELIKQFGLPQNVIGVGAISLGYPVKNPEKALPRKENYYRIIR
ncbi:MAG: nitroreductase family protein [Bacteroidales bacterium]|nr:nitroreductase family protein [Bacteroidales bacterium]